MADHEHADRVAVFGAAPRLVITVDPTEQRSLHLHAGGQGVWIARMIRRLGAMPLLCGVIGGETGQAIERLVADEDIELRSVPSRNDSGASVYAGSEADPDDRWFESSDPPLDRHEFDRLYDLVLASALETRLCVLAGSNDADILPADAFRRLALDLPANGVRVIADLSGEQLEAAVEGGVEVLKVSDEDLVRDGTASSTDTDEIRRVVDDLRGRGAGDVIVTRADAETIARVGDEWLLIEPPKLVPVNAKGAGDSLTGALAVAMCRGLGHRDALKLATAAAATSVTRHGLATADREAIELLSDRVRIETMAPANAGTHDR